MKTSVRLILALAVSAVPAFAQEVQVRATNQTTGAPLAGALISLRDPRDRVVLRVLADERGRATVKAPVAGPYRVRADAIGYAGKLADPIRLDAATPQSITIALEPAPLSINELVVASSREVVCKIDQAAGTAVARIWDEARKALTATTLTRANQALQFEVQSFDRELDLRGRVVSEVTNMKRGSSRRPFQSIDPEVLHRSGYVGAEEGDSVRYSAPDADLLLSDRFLDDHCFDLADPDKANAGRVGLAFTPIQSRPVSDVQGTLWLDERTMELSHLEFRYTNVDLPEDARDIGGRIEFVRLSNGGWIISHWRIRMPLLYAAPFGHSRLRLRGYREAGGEATPLGQPRVMNAPTAIVGTVFDSIAGAPLGGVAVSIQAGAFADTTDAAGRFRIVSPGVGQYLVTFEHPRFRLFGLDSVFAGAKLIRGFTDTVSAAIPSAATVAAKLCPDDGADVAVIVGTTRDAATTTPIAAIVTIRSSTIAVRASPSSGARGSRNPGRRVSVSDRGISWEVDTDATGRFRVCGLPQAADLEVAVQVKGRRAVERVVSTEGKRLLEVDVAVP